MGLGLFSMQATAGCGSEAGMGMACCQKEFQNHSHSHPAERNGDISGTQHKNRPCRDACPSCRCFSMSVFSAFLNNWISGNSPFENPHPSPYFYKREGISPGYLSIWRPPKIG